MGEGVKPSGKIASKTGGIARRTIYALNVPSEDAIRAAQEKVWELVEMYPNDERLSETHRSLSKAKGLLSDFIDDYIEKQL